MSATPRRRACWATGWRQGVLRADAKPAFYVHEQQFTLPQAAGRIYTRRGFFAAVRLEPYERRMILPHEKTLAGPKEDRLKLMRATRTQISPIFGSVPRLRGVRARDHRPCDGGDRGARRHDGRRDPASALAARRAGGDRRPGAAPRRQADPDRRRPPSLRDAADAGPRAALARLRGGGRRGRLRHDVPGARRGSGPAGAADASAGPRAARLRLPGALRGGGRGLRHRGGRRGDGPAPSRSGWGARGRRAWRSRRGCRGGTGRPGSRSSRSSISRRWGRRCCASWT